MSYATTILAEASLVSYWQLGDLTGTAAVDSSSGLNPGTYTGGFTLNQSTSYPLTPAVTFNGSTGYVDVADATNLHLTNVTIEAFINTTSAMTQEIISKYNNGSPNLGWGIRLESTGLLSIYAGTNAWIATPTPAIKDGNWHHVVGTISSGGLINLYVDSILQLSSGLTQSLSNTAHLNIGRSPNNANYFNGKIMHCAVYNAVLSQSAISNHFAQVTDSGAIRNTQEPVRTLITPSDQAIRETQIPVRTLISPSSQAIRNTQEPVRTLITPSDQAIRITQMPIRILRLNVGGGLLKISPDSLNQNADFKGF